MSSKALRSKKMKMSMPMPHSKPHKHKSYILIGYLPVSRCGCALLK